MTEKQLVENLQRDYKKANQYMPKRFIPAMIWMKSNMMYKGIKEYAKYKYNYDISDKEWYKDNIRLDKKYWIMPPHTCLDIVSLYESNQKRAQILEQINMSLPRTMGFFQKVKYYLYTLIYKFL